MNNYVDKVERVIGAKDCHYYRREYKPQSCQRHVSWKYIQKTDKRWGNRVDKRTIHEGYYIDDLEDCLNDNVDMMLDDFTYEIVKTVVEMEAKYARRGVQRFFVGA